MTTATITYEIVTPESAEYGEVAEHGFYQPGGWRYPIPPGLSGDAFTRWCEETGNADPVEYDDIKDLARCALYNGYTSDGPGSRWLTYGGGSDDWEETEDGEHGIETRHLHPGDDVTPEEWDQVLAWVASGRVPA